MKNTVQIASTQVNVKITESQSNINVIQAQTKTVKIITPGPQGPPGEAAQGYKHTQSSPSTTWTITHNLGFYPSVELLNAGSQEIEGDVVHLSQNVTVAYFTTPIAGFARLI